MHSIVVVFNYNYRNLFILLSRCAYQKKLCFKSVVLIWIWSFTHETETFWFRHELTWKQEDAELFEEFTTNFPISPSPSVFNGWTKPN